MKELSVEQMENTQGGKFWGSSETCGPCDFTGHQWCNQAYYVFWTLVSLDSSYKEC